MRLKSLIVGAFVALLALPAIAQEGTPTRIRGKVEKLDGQTLYVKSRDGQEVKVALAPDFNVMGVTKAKLSDIKPGQFIGAAALKGKDGKLHAQELVIFPEFARGMAEGHYPWDLTPDSTMTNATVAEVTGTKARTLNVKYKDGEQQIVISSKAPVVTFDKADASLLKRGTSVFIPATKLADGTIAGKIILAGKKGVVPPM